MVVPLTTASAAAAGSMTDGPDVGAERNHLVRRADGRSRDQSASEQAVNPVHHRWGELTHWRCLPPRLQFEGVNFPFDSSKPGLNGEKPVFDAPKPACKVVDSFAEIIEASVIRGDQRPHGDDHGNHDRQCDLEKWLIKHYQVASLPSNPRAIVCAVLLTTIAVLS